MLCPQAVVMYRFFTTMGKQPLKNARTNKGFAATQWTRRRNPGGTAEDMRRMRDGLNGYNWGFNFQCIYI